MEKIRFRKIASDVGLNLISAIIPIAVLQVFILPSLAQKLGSSGYGSVITLVSLIYVISLPLGNALNNTRLLQNSEYEDKLVVGDFNILLLISIVVNSVFILVGYLYYSTDGTWLDILLIVLIGSINIQREYFIVAFRLKLDYLAILVNNILLCLGYIGGWLLFSKIGYWQFIYLIGALCSIIYIISQSSLHKEPYKLTRLFKYTSKKYSVLVITSFLSNVVTYADKLLLYPLLGPDSVSVYYSATLISKIISMGVSPTSSVILSYLSKIKTFSKQNFYYLLIITSIVGAFGGLLCILISRPILTLLYPEWVEKSLQILNLVIASAIFTSFSTVINPFVLKFCDINWQIFLGVINIIIYLGFSYIFYSAFGLKGFVFGILVSSIIQFLIKIVIYLKNSNSFAQESDKAN